MMRLGIYIRNWIENLQKSLEKKKFVFGETDKSIGVLNFRLELSFESTRESEKALQGYLKAFEIAQRNSENTGEICSEIGSAYEKLGQYGKALEFYFKALDIYFEVFGEVHPLVALMYAHCTIC